MPYAVGDAVWVYLSGVRQDQQGTVTRIGRTLVEIQACGVTRKYLIAGQSQQGGYRGSFRTEAQRAEVERRRDAIDRLDQFGVKSGGRYWTGWPTDNLVALGDAAAELAPPST